MSQLRERIGGRWAISRTAYIVAAPTSIVSVLLVVPNRLQSNTGHWWLISTTTYLGFALLLYVFHKTWFRNRATKPIAPLVVMLTGFLLGTLKGLATWGMASAFGIPHTSTPLLSSLSTGLTVAVGMPALAYIAATFAELTKQHQHYSASRTALFTQESANAENFNQLKMDLNSVIKARINASENSAGANSTALRQLVDEVRPLSHEFWKKSQITLPRYNPSGLLKVYAANQSIEFWPVFLVYSLTSAVGIANFAGAEGPLLRVLVTLGIFGLVLKLLELILLRGNRRDLGWHLVAVLVLSLTVSVLPAWLVGDFEGVEVFVSFLLSILWIGTLVFSIGFIMNAERFGDTVLQQLQNRVDDAKLRAVAVKNLQAKLTRDVATYLHGKYQSQLLGIATAMDEAEAAGEVERYQVLLHQAIELLADPLRHMQSVGITEPSDAADESGEAMLQELVSQWQGIVEIEVASHCESAAEIDSRAAVLAVLLDEAVRNAFRHGYASRLVVGIECLADSVRVRVVDDGHGVADDSRRGIGSALFDSHCGDRWSLLNRQDGLSGAVLELEVS